MSETGFAVVSGALLLTACSRPAPTEEPVRAVKVLTVGIGSFNSGYEFAGEVTRYLMVVLMLLGFAAYFQLGQDGDPPFTFHAMVVRAYWPGRHGAAVAIMGGLMVATALTLLAMYAAWFRVKRETPALQNNPSGGADA